MVLGRGDLPFSFLHSSTGLIGVSLGRAAWWAMHFFLHVLVAGRGMCFRIRCNDLGTACVYILGDDKECLHSVGSAVVGNVWPPVVPLHICVQLHVHL